MKASQMKMKNREGKVGVRAVRRWPIRFDMNLDRFCAFLQSSTAVPLCKCLILMNPRTLCSRRHRHHSPELKSQIKPIPALLPRSPTPLIFSAASSPPSPPRSPTPLISEDAIKNRVPHRSHSSLPPHTPSTPSHIPIVPAQHPLPLPISTLHRRRTAPSNHSF